MIIYFKVQSVEVRSYMIRRLVALNGAIEMVIGLTISKTGHMTLKRVRCHSHIIGRILHTIVAFRAVQSEEQNIQFSVSFDD